MWKTIDHISIRVRDLDGAQRFYQQVLGFSEVDRQEIPAEGLTLVTMARGDDRVELLYAPGHNKAPGLDHLALEVGDVAETVRQLQEAGVTETLEIRETLSGDRICFFHGPSGERVELIERRKDK